MPILFFCRVLAGPFATMILGGLGAELKDQTNSVLHSVSFWKKLNCCRGKTKGAHLQRDTIL